MTYQRPVAVLVIAIGVGLTRLPAHAAQDALDRARAPLPGAAQIAQLVQRHVEQGEIPGAVVLLARGGRIAALQAFGWADVESKRPMREDSLFRLASAAKIVTTVGLLALCDEGRLGLDDPVGTYLPELRRLKVRGADGHISAAARSVTIRDLLRHTNGYVYGNDDAQRSAYRDAGLMPTGSDDDWSHAFTLAEWVGRLATVPLDSEPGTRFEYGFGADIAGALIERVTAQRLDEFLRARVLGPLKMKDTGFVVPAADLSRLTSVYLVKDARFERLDVADRSPFRRRPKALSGGGGWDMLGNGGLVSSAPDQFRLLQMLLGGGSLEGVRILKASTVDMMFANHLEGLAVPERSPGVGFGLGYAIVDDAARYGEPSGQGLMWWSGSTNTRYWLLPREQLIGLYLTQVQPFPHLDVMNTVMRLSLQVVE